MPSANDILKIARAELGTKESPSGSNKVKYNSWYYGREVSGSAYPWCAAFTSWVLNQCGITDYKSVSCPAIKSMAIKKGTYNKGSNGIKASDLVLYQFDKDSDPDHIGIVESVSGSSIVAIEGNTSVTSDDNGGCVMRRTRSKGLIMGYVSVCEASIKKCTVELPELKKVVREMQLLHFRHCFQSEAVILMALTEISETTQKKLSSSSRRRTILLMTESSEPIPGEFLLDDKRERNAPSFLLQKPIPLEGISQKTDNYWG